nr:MAG TPA: hypothetical protein [Caudoviricetes sp.]
MRFPQNGNNIIPSAGKKGRNNNDEQREIQPVNQFVRQSPPYLQYLTCA